MDNEFGGYSGPLRITTDLLRNVSYQYQSEDFSLIHGGRLVIRWVFRTGRVREESSMNI